ncbi:hypothetical protein KO493_12830 [Tamlana agarivorans]|uniref:Uncharacterized protein n=1 Tax=Pseudotamlana agarivorans TaxID=481183 RepID=A0ACC5UB90_9FLAO|nr:hypothetical protein [Tamlana agarivorans]MBU2951584.1 hypothetical protein [Tamlana agarivorans]
MRLNSKPFQIFYSICICYIEASVNKETLNQQVYRFVKKNANVSSAVTFLTTTDTNGATREDEENVLKYVNSNLL